MAKRIRKSSMGSKTFYEYDNGVKVCVNHIEEAQDTTKIFFQFNGGSNVQGKYDGLAHFSEHIMFNNPQFFGLVLGGGTGSNATYFRLEIKKEEFGNLTKEQVLEKLLPQRVNTFFECVKSEDVDINKFEDEKKIVDSEWGLAEYSRQYNNQEIYSDYLTGYRHNKNCGNYQTLKLVTVQDYLNYKKASYTKENLIVFIDTDSDYESYEKVLIDCIDKNAPSNPKTIYPSSSDITKVTNAYLINKRNNGGESDDFVNVFVGAVFDKRLLKENKDLVVGAMAFRELFEIASLKRLHFNLRENKNYTYTLDNDFDETTLWLVNYVAINTRKENVSDAILTIAQSINEVVQGYEQEDFYKIKKNMTQEQINDFFIANCNKDIWKDYPPEYMQNLYQIFQTCDVEYLKDCLKKYAKLLKVNIVLSKNADLSNLPDIDYLAQLVMGEQAAQTLNLVKTKSKKAIKPIELDFVKRNLPMVIEREVR